MSDLTTQVPASTSLVRLYRDADGVVYHSTEAQDDAMIAAVEFVQQQAFNVPDGWYTMAMLVHFKHGKAISATNMALQAGTV